MLGEKSAERGIKRLLRRLAHAGEEVLGWDTGSVTVLQRGQVTEVSGLLVATPNTVLLVNQANGQAAVIPWESISSTETRQDRWKTNFILHLRDGGSITLRSSSARPVQTLISDWVEAGVRQRASTEPRIAEQGYVSVDDTEAMAYELRRRWEEGELNPPPSFKLKDPDLDVSSLPQTPISSWRSCPACDGKLLVFEGIADCSDCRRLWSDPKVGPLLDKETGRLIGREERIPMSPTDFETGDWLKPIAYLRWPSRDGRPWPLPGDPV